MSDGSAGSGVGSLLLMGHESCCVVAGKISLSPLTAGISTNYYHSIIA